MKLRHYVAATSLLFALIPCHAQSDPWASVGKGLRQSSKPISCTVMKLDKARAVPILHLLCPAKQVFAPLRVYMQVSWNELKEVPQSVDELALPSVVNMRSNHSEIDVQMDVDQDGKHSRQWFAFTNLVGLGLVQEKP